MVTPCLFAVGLYLLPYFSLLILFQESDFGSLSSAIMLTLAYFLQ